MPSSPSLPNDPISTVFECLDRWRNLPAYQLERRADIFFAVYLQEVVADVTGVELAASLVPELPIKRDLIWPEQATNQSVKVDYCLFAKDLSRVFFVELKTDPGSRRAEQDEYLGVSEGLRFRTVVEGVLQIARASTARQKYFHLLAELRRAGFVDLPDDLETFVFPPRRGLSQKLAEAAATDLDAPIEVIYVQPDRSAGERVVDFETFAGIVDRHDDPFSRTFAAHLRRWTVPAGSKPVQP